MSTTKHNDVTLTAAGEREMARIDVDGDGIISTEEARAAAMSSAELRASNSRLWKMVFGVFALLVLSWLGNAGLMAVVINLSKDLQVEGGSLKNTDGGAVSTHNQKTKYSVTHDVEKNATESRRRLQAGGSIQVATVPCAVVQQGIKSIQDGDNEGAVEMQLDEGTFTASVTANFYRAGGANTTFGIVGIHLDGNLDVAYAVECEEEKCSNVAGYKCPVLGLPVTEEGRRQLGFEFLVLSAATPSTRRALSFEEAFDGDQKVSRRRLTATKLTSAELLGEVYQNSTSGDSLNTVDDLCALVPNSSQGGVAKLCKDLLGVGLDDSIYCGQEVLQETEEAPFGSASPEPSFTMREVLASADTEQTYNAVVDRCQPTTARRQMWNIRENYGWCSTALGFVAARASSRVIGQEDSAHDSANYCDASTSEASQGKGSQLSGCCVEHDKCMACEKSDRSCTGSSKTGGNCDRELSTCAWAVSCSTQTTYSVWSWSWWRGWSQVTKTIRGYDFTCAAVSTLIASAMGFLPNGGSTCQTG